MLKIKKTQSKTPASAVTFETPTLLQKIGIEMLITLNMAKLDLLTGLDVNENMRILVTKDKPHFFFNPVIFEPNSLHPNGKDNIITLQYHNYQGNEHKIEINDDGSIEQAVDYLNNGIQKVTKKKGKKNAD